MILLRIYGKDTLNSKFLSFIKSNTEKVLGVVIGVGALTIGGIYLLKSNNKTSETPVTTSITTSVNEETEDEDSTPDETSSNSAPPEPPNSLPYTPPNSSSESTSITTSVNEETEDEDSTPDETSSNSAPPEPPDSLPYIPPNSSSESTPVTLPATSLPKNTNDFMNSKYKIDPNPPDTIDIMPAKDPNNTQLAAKMDSIYDNYYDPNKDNLIEDIEIPNKKYGPYTTSKFLYLCVKSIDNIGFSNDDEIYKHMYDIKNEIKNNKREWIMKAAHYYTEMQIITYEFQNNLSKNLMQNDILIFLSDWYKNIYEALFDGSQENLSLYLSIKNAFDTAIKQNEDSNKLIFQSK